MLVKKKEFRNKKQGDGRMAARKEGSGKEGW